MLTPGIEVHTCSFYYKLTLYNPPFRVWCTICHASSMEKKKTSSSASVNHIDFSTLQRPTKILRWCIRDTFFFWKLLNVKILFFIPHYLPSQYIMCNVYLKGQLDVVEGHAVGLQAEEDSGPTQHRML